MKDKTRKLLAIAAVVLACGFSHISVARARFLDEFDFAKTDPSAPDIITHIDQKSGAAQDSRVRTLIDAVAKEYPTSEENPYSLIHIGVTEYLVKDGKILRTRKAEKIGGVCRKYASIWMGVSDSEMNAKSEGETSMWKLEAGGWQKFFNSSAGDYSCEQMKQIPHALWKCLGVDACV